MMPLESPAVVALRRIQDPGLGPFRIPPSVMDPEGRIPWGIVCFSGL